MSVLKFTAGRKGGSGAHAGYITRNSACDSISFHNLEELETGDQSHNKVNAISYAYNREEEEQEINPNGRSHYKMVLSFDRKEETDKAKEMTHEFLDKNFENSRAIVSIHQDTPQTHAHIWIDARNMDDRKLHSPRNHINELSRSWQHQYDREYNTKYEKEFAEKREEMRQWREDKHKGIDRPKPERATMTTEKWREKDERDKGVIKTYGIDESRTGGDQRSFKVRESKSESADRAVSGSQRNIAKSEQLSNRATEQSNRTESATRELRDEFEQMAQKSRKIEDRGDNDR